MFIKILLTISRLSSVCEISASLACVRDITSPHVTFLFPTAAPELHERRSIGSFGSHPAEPTQGQTDFLSCSTLQLHNTLPRISLRFVCAVQVYSPLGEWLVVMSQVPHVVVGAPMGARASPRSVRLVSPTPREFNS